MKLSTWSVAAPNDHANFGYRIFARSQHPHNTIADVLKRVKTSMFYCGRFVSPMCLARLYPIQCGS